jgi:hypothetical protein
MRFARIHIIPTPTLRASNMQPPRRAGSEHAPLEPVHTHTPVRLVKEPQLEVEARVATLHLPQLLEHVLAQGAWHRVRVWKRQQHVLGRYPTPSRGAPIVVWAAPSPRKLQPRASRDMYMYI